MVVTPHRVDVVVLGDEAGMLRATRNFPDRDVVRAEAGNWKVSVLVSFFLRWETQSQLSTAVGAPAENLGIVCFLLLSVDVQNQFFLTLSHSKRIRNKVVFRRTLPNHRIVIIQDF